MRRILCSLLFPGLGLVCFAGCYGATEIRVSIRTDVACETVRQNGISIRATGATASLADATVIASSTHCEDGEGGQLNDLGTIVFVPTSGTPQVSIRVVLGVQAPTDTCDPLSSNGCIIADRRLAYEKHSTLQLPIRLDDACIGRVCGDGQTCAAGVCVTSSASCSGTSCGSVEPEDASTPPINTPPIALPDSGGVTPGDAGPILPDASVCAPARNTGCGCNPLSKRPFCCLTVAGPLCTADQDACRSEGSFGCTDACQCEGRGCGPATNCGGGSAVVCGSSCLADR